MVCIRMVFLMNDEELMEMKTKTEIKIKKQFPFFYLYTRSMTDIEMIFDNAHKAENLMFSLLPIIATAKIIKFLKNL